MVCALPETDAYGNTSDKSLPPCPAAWKRSALYTRITHDHRAASTSPGSRWASQTGSTLQCSLAKNTQDYECMHASSQLFLWPPVPLLLSVASWSETEFYRVGAKPIDQAHQAGILVSSPVILVERGAQLMRPLLPALLCCAACRA